MSVVPAALPTSLRRDQRPSGRFSRLVRWVQMGGPVAVANPPAAPATPAASTGSPSVPPPPPAPAPDNGGTPPTPLTLQVLEDAGPLLLAAMLTVTIAVLSIEGRPIPEALIGFEGGALGYYFRARLGAFAGGDRTP